MIILTLNNIGNLNTSLQVGDLIYRTGVMTQAGAEDLEDRSMFTGTPVGDNGHMVGILRRITILVNSVVLDVDETAFIGTVIPLAGDFIMFSKYSQTDGDVVGYYAQAKFINDSKKEAELFSVGSEVIINSK